MKMFRTTDNHMVAECQAYFAFDLPSVHLAKQSTLLNFWTNNRSTSFGKVKFI